MNKERGIVVGLTLIMAGVAINGIGGLKEKRLGSEYITVAIPGSLPGAQSFTYQVGIRNEIYLKERINLELVSMKGALIPMALVGGGIDYSGSPSQPITAALIGARVKVVLIVLGESLPSFLVSHPNIKLVTELKGKKIAVASLCDRECQGMKDVARHFGLNPEKDINLVFTGPAIKEQALIGGSVNAAVVTMASIYFVKKRGFRVLIQDMGEYSDQFRGLGGPVLGTNTERLKRNPDQVKRMIRATLKSLDYLRNNREEVIDYMHKDWGWERDRAKEFYDFYVKTRPRRSFISSKEEITKGIERYIENEKAQGLKVSAGIGIADFLDLRFLMEIEKELEITP